LSVRDWKKDTIIEEGVAERGVIERAPQQIAQLTYLREKRPLDVPAIRTFFETLLPGAADA
jgi:hypothetical protein